MVVMAVTVSLARRDQLDRREKMEIKEPRDLQDVKGYRENLDLKGYKENRDHPDRKDLQVLKEFEETLG